MSDYKFGVGEYKTRDGRTAVVEFVMREPYPGNYKLRGQTQLHNNDWADASWTLDGQFYINEPESGADLVPPVKYAWMAVAPFNASEWCFNLSDALATVSKPLGALRGIGQCCGTVAPPYEWFTVEDAEAFVEREGK